MTQTIYGIVCAALLATIVAVLPASCDREYELEHPYISPSDKMIIDSRDK